MLWFVLHAGEDACIEEATLLVQAGEATPVLHTGAGEAAEGGSTGTRRGHAALPGAVGRGCIFLCFFPNFQNQ